MKYRVGDNIEIKSLNWWHIHSKKQIDDEWVISSNYCGKIEHFTEYMAKMCCGKVGEIVEISRIRSTYTIEVPPAIFEIREEWIKGYKESVAHKKLFNWKYKVGDKVKVKSFEWWNRNHLENDDQEYSPNKFINSDYTIDMALEFGGKVGEIIKVSETNFRPYLIQFENKSWTFHENWIEDWNYKPEFSINKPFKYDV